MYAYYEIEAHIPNNHQLTIQLPDNIPTGRAKIAIIYEVNQISNDLPKPKTIIDFLGAGKVCKRFFSIAEIDAFVTENRGVWESVNHATIDK